MTALDFRGTKKGDKAVKTREMIKIDGEKLRKEIQLRGLTVTGCAQRIYRAGSTLNNALARNAINKDIADALEGLCNIPLSMYKIPDAEEETSKEEKTSGFDYDEMYKMIYSAVYEAVKKAWSE